MSDGVDDRAWRRGAQSVERVLETGGVRLRRELLQNVDNEGWIAISDRGYPLRDGRHRCRVERCGGQFTNGGLRQPAKLQPREAILLGEIGERSLERRSDREA